MADDLHLKRSNCLEADEDKRANRNTSGWNDDLKEMLRKHSEKEDFNNWIRKFRERKYESDFAREMSRSVRVFLDTLGL